MQKSTEKYKLCLHCKCMNCKKETIKNEPYSCKTYPKRYGIPAEIWNGKNVKCPYFEEKK